MGRCNVCLKEFDESFGICPHCGAAVDYNPVEPIHLIPGTILADRYYIGKAVGSGGFGIIYKAWDAKLETIVAVKEFYVSRIMTRAPKQKEVIINRKSMQEFSYRKERFLAEARTMACFGAHRNIPNVFEFFEENGTAYIVMELLEGQPLNQYMREKGGKIDKDFALMITHEIGNALKALHEKGIIHRDVAPDNIFICSGAELRIKLLDLGAAKLADSTDDVIDIVLKPGYSPSEQYDNTNNIGPWTDMYALGATLYIMLTGIKPEESTNRKKEDKVLYPKELDDSISENFSNSVMKAMAVEKHMRFKSIDEFMKAIDGERKVVSIVKEKKQRVRRRLLGICMSCILLAVLGIGVFQFFEHQRSVKVLKDATISIWYCAEPESDEAVAMTAMVEDFQTVYPNIKIELERFSESEYFDKLKNAAEDNELPSLFESTGVSENVLSKAHSISNVLKSSQAGDCLFLDQYDDYYKNKKQIPLAIEVPVAFIITEGNTFADYEESTFDSISDFENQSYAMDSDYSSLLNRNFKVVSFYSKGQFLDNQANECAILLSSSMAMNLIRNTLTNYEKKCVFYAAEEVQANFTYEWSIGIGSKAEIAAAERLLSWMLGNKYQNMLMISRCSDGQIPVNEECFQSKARLSYYEPLKSIYKKFVFRKE